MTDPWDALRYVNLALAVIVAALTIARLRELWPAVPAEVRLARLSTIGFAVAIAYATLEQLLDGIPGGPRAVVGLCALGLALASPLVPDRFRLFPRNRRRRNRQEPHP